MTALLTDNLPLLAGAPNGIKKLRELILELAVRGKLVEQDASDEPASELLKLIAVEKARLVEEGKIKKQKPLSDIDALEKPYALPAGWEWTTLPGAASYQIGKTPPTKEAKYWSDSGLPWVSISDMEHYGEITKTSRLISEVARKDVFKYPPVPAGTLLMSFKLTVGKVAVLGIDAYHNEAIISLSPYSGVSKEYLFRFLPSIALGGRQKNALMGNTLNSESMAQLLVPIPPLAEQHRIVAKVDELMALCDSLEAQQADAASAHVQLVQALLGSLTQTSMLTAKDGGNAGTISGHEFTENWQRLAEHFHTIFTTEPSIDALKQTLLQLAVMGKLVPQDPSDEPASELLKRIEAEKQSLVADGKLKKQKPLNEITEQEKAHQLPSQWVWTRLGEVSTRLNDGNYGEAYPKASELVSAGIPFLTSASIGPSGTVELCSLKFITPQKHSELTKAQIEPGDVIFPNRGARGGQLSGAEPLAILVPEWIEEGNINPQLTRIKTIKNTPLSRYLCLNLNSVQFTSQLKAATTGTALAFINLTTTASFVIALPPLAEQHRIVAKVDQLMALCDQLKTQLSQARQLNQQLASTLVEQAVA